MMALVNIRARFHFDLDQESERIGWLQIEGQRPAPVRLADLDIDEEAKELVRLNWHMLPDAIRRARGAR